VPSRDPLQRFQDILDNIERIERFTAGLDAQSFCGDEQVVFAVQHALLIISEAAAKLGDLAASHCPEIAWRDIRGLRNRLRHDYPTIDVARLWTTVQRDLPALKAGAQRALTELQGREGRG
jgi:uncharacterized protein with HEPN domain